MKTITPFLWFNNNAEEAIDFYTSIFKNSKVLSVSRYGEGGPGPAGLLMTATFQLEGQQFMALNGGPEFPFTEAISLYVSCETQPELDELWDKLSEGSQAQQCGWVQDRFGLWWQIIPPAFGELMSEPDPVKVQRMMQAMRQMTRIDIAKLIEARDTPVPAGS